MKWGFRVCCLCAVALGFRSLRLEPVGHGSETGGDAQGLSFREEDYRARKGNGKGQRGHRERSGQGDGRFG